MTVRHRRLTVGLHAGMLAIMVAAMVLHSAPVALAGAGLLLVTAMVLAPQARADRRLHGHLADLVAMGAALAVSAMGAPVGGHGHAAAPRVLLAVVIVLWVAVRVALVARNRRGAVSAVVTGAGLGAMALM